jgi:hypothetical protein
VHDVHWGGTGYRGDSGKSVNVAPLRLRIVVTGRAT